MRKIVFFIESLIGGGAEKQMVDLVNHLDFSRYEVTVVALFKQSVYDNYDFRFDIPFDKHIRYITLVNNQNKLLYRLFNHSFTHLSKQWVYRFLVKEKYDVEIAYYEGMPTQFVASSSNKNSIKYAWLHTDNHRLYKDSSTAYKQEVAEMYSKYDCVIGVSEYVRKSFSFYYPDINTAVIHNGIDLDRITLLAKEKCPINKEKKMAFLTIGRMTKVKGYFRLLKAFKRLKEEGHFFTLTMIGAGEEFDELNNYVKENCLSEDVFFEGAQNNPYKYMKYMDYFVCSSYYEGYSLTTAEAIACNLPVLTTDCNVQAEVFGGNECGIICENNDESIYQMIKYAILHPEIRNRFIEECKQRKKELSLNKTIEKFERLVNEQ